MIQNYHYDLEETGNLLVAGLRDGNKLAEAIKYAEDMIERGIKLNSLTVSKLKQSLSKTGKTLGCSAEWLLMSKRLQDQEQEVLSIELDVAGTVLVLEFQLFQGNPEAVAQLQDNQDFKGMMC
ncbi:uncharacterized protein LOC113760059 [Coffea eugenioides]|uniref:uncharacterized protein LOC113760059 n=1 Tax=Coffea eugenioides TaxID=49369 RepID=UPI000F5C3495|nr:uncharacterized protein LOC113701169 [Coffea arabica]XP_027158433.1 uncharacterized protein LOC113760059 [Coffea eugenioides]